MSTFTEWLEQYRTAILPIKDKAEAGGPRSNGLYERYDNAYNEHLEELHNMVLDADAKKLDAVDALLAAAERAVEAANHPEDFVEGNAAYQDLIAAAAKAKGGA